jgi:hypothetical protein
LFGNTGQNAQQNQQPGGIFGQSQQQSGFGTGFGQQNQAQQPAGMAGIFSGLGQNNQQQQQQGTSLFGGPNQTAFGQSTQQQQLGQSNALWQPGSGFGPRMYPNLVFCS